MDTLNGQRFVVEERTPEAWHLIDTGVRDVETGELGKVIHVYADEKKARSAAELRNKRKMWDLIGTAEAAEILDVERPRIGRWKKSGLMPVPVVELASGPVWLRRDVLAMTGEREKRRRQKGGSG